MGEVVRFQHPRGGRSYRIEFVLFEGKKRREWVVIERAPDGTESYDTVARGSKKEAIFRANLGNRAEAQRQRHLTMLASDPLGKAILALSPDQRDLMRELLQAEKQLRS